MCGVCEGGLGAVNMEGYKWEMIFKEEIMNSSLLVGSFYIFYFFVKTFTVFIYSFFLIQLTFLLPMP